MKLVAIHVATVPLMSTIRNAVIDFSQMDASVVAVVTDVVRDGRPVVGYGFNSNGRYAQTALMRDRFLPRIMSAPPDAVLNDEQTNLDPDRIWHIAMTGEKPGGHGERSVALGALDMAIWDAVAKVEELPLHVLLAQRYGDGTPDADVWVYAAGGYYQPEKDIEALQAELRGYVALGYSTCKIKIGGAPLEDDLRRIEAALEIVGDGSHLCVDANGRFDRDTALAYAEALAPYNLRWYEEPVDPLDYALHAEVAAAYAPPLATGENLFSMQDARNLLRHGGLRADRDVLQMDPALSYGLVEYLRTLQALRDHGWSPRTCVPHGGHMFALAMAAGLGLGGNESYPGIFQPFGGFADDTPITDSRITPGTLPGIGIEGKSALYALMQATFG